MDERLEFCHNGISHLICVVSLPALPEGKAGKRIESFLTAASQAAKKNAERALAHLAERYEKDPDPKKRFRHRPAYLSLSFSLSEEKTHYRIEQRLLLTRGARTLFEKRRAARFDLQSGRFIKEIHGKKNGQKG